MGKTFLLTFAIFIAMASVANAQEILSENKAKKILNGGIKPYKIEIQKRDTCTDKAFYFGEHLQNVYEVRQVTVSGKMFFRVEEDGVLVWKEMKLKRDCQKIIGDPVLNPEKKVMLWYIKDKHKHDNKKEQKEYFSQTISVYSSDDK